MQLKNTAAATIKMPGNGKKLKMSNKNDNGKWERLTINFRVVETVKGVKAKTHLRTNEFSACFSLFFLLLMFECIFSMLFLRSVILIPVTVCRFSLDSCVCVRAGEHEWKYPHKYKLCNEMCKSKVNTLIQHWNTHSSPSFCCWLAHNGLRCTSRYFLFRCSKQNNV